MQSPSSKNPSQWKAALTGRGSCISPPEMEAYLAESIEAARRKVIDTHLADCATCRTELGLYSKFLQSSARDEETAAVDWVNARLVERSPEILGRRIEKQASESWWKSLLTVPSMQRVSLAFASVIIVVFIGLYVRSQREPILNQGTGQSIELRSGQTIEISPQGDVLQAPSELRWSAVPSVARYKIRLLEVDRTVLWSAEAAEPRIEIPPTVLARLGPGKTILWEVQAISSAGKTLAESGIRSLRINPGR